LNTFLESQKPQLKDSVEISSAFPISESFLHQMSDLIEKSQKKKFKIETRQAPELLLGIELTMESSKIAWNIEDYLQKLQEKVDQAFAQFETTE
jgi:F0F1-type ATP synthase delta subunit